MKVTSLNQFTRVASYCLLRIKQVDKGEIFTVKRYVWSNTTSNVNKLQKVQNFAARIVSNTRKYDHITSVLKKLKWLPVKNYLYYRDAILAFKCMTGLAPNYLCNKFICRGDVSKRNPRNSQLLNIPFFKTTTGQRSFSDRVVNIWNNLPTDIKLKMLQVLKLN